MVQLNRPYVVDNALPWETQSIENLPAVAAQFPTMANFANDRSVQQMNDLEAMRYSITPAGVMTGEMSGPQREILLALIGEIY